MSETGLDSAKDGFDLNLAETKGNPSHKSKVHGCGFLNRSSDQNVYLCYLLMEEVMSLTTLKIFTFTAFLTATMKKSAFIINVFV